MSNDKKEEIRIIEALIFASEKSISITELKKKLPTVKDIKKSFV
jgi:chromosome segregation and condensation protein ScpB